MRKVIIIGNFGSGKSTLARELVASDGLAHLDLDEITWLPGYFALRRAPLEQSLAVVENFLDTHDKWVIEGMYVDILDKIKSASNELFFLNIPENQCIQNGLNRPWEPHKFDSKESQDNNLQRLINSKWIQNYATRDDIYSFKAHMKFFQAFEGKKTMYTDYMLR